MSLSPVLAFMPFRDVFQACERGGPSRMGPWILHVEASTRLISEKKIGRPNLAQGDWRGKKPTGRPRGAGRGLEGVAAVKTGRLKTTFSPPPFLDPLLQPP